MIKSFEIVGAYHTPKNKRKATKCFPGLNDYLGRCYKGRQEGIEYKQKYKNITIRKARLQLKNWKAKGRVRLHYYFGEPIDGDYRDQPNIRAFAEKVIEDALQDMKVIVDDSPKYLAPSRATYIYTNKEKPFIRVDIEEIGPLVEIKDIGQEE